MATTTFSTLSADAVTYIREELLDLAEKLVVFAQFAEKVTLPQHNSKTIQFSRYPYLSLPTTPVTEGVTPSDTTLSVQTVTATVDQWMLTVTLSDLAQLTIKHPLVPVVTDLLGYAMAQLVDREIYQTLLAGATVVFPSAVASRGALTSSNVLDDATMMKVSATMRNLGARSTDGMNYVLVVDSFQEQDVINQTGTFLAAHQFKNVEALYNGEIGRWRGFRVVRSNLAPVIQLITTGSIAGAASASGTLAAGSTYSIKITGTETQYGFETQVKATTDTSPGGGNNALTVTLPATSGYTYNIYMADAAGGSSTDAHLFLVASGLAAGATYTVTAVQTTGDNPPATPPSGVNVHVAFALGRQAFAMVKLSGDNMRVMVTDQRPSDSDPGAQRRKLSFKGSFKAVVLNSDFLRRIETASAFG